MSFRNVCAVLTSLNTDKSKLVSGIFFKRTSPLHQGFPILVLQNSSGVT